jgi:hypothetical protein
MRLLGLASLAAIGVTACSGAIAPQGQTGTSSSAINNKLRHFPQFANAVGIHCVRDCEGARAFNRAYAEYERAHPEFDLNEPMEE